MNTRQLYKEDVGKLSIFIVLSTYYLTFRFLLLSLTCFRNHIQCVYCLRVSQNFHYRTIHVLQDERFFEK